MAVLFLRGAVGLVWRYVVVVVVVLVSVVMTRVTGFVIRHALSNSPCLPRVSLTSTRYRHNGDPHTHHSSLMATKSVPEAVVDLLRTDPAKCLEYKQLDKWESKLEHVLRSFDDFTADNKTSKSAVDSHSFAQIMSLYDGMLRNIMSTSKAVNPLQYAVINAVMDELFENFIAQQVQSDVALKSAVESLTSTHMLIVDHLFPANSQ
jgi:hypothetical protein